MVLRVGKSCGVCRKKLNASRMRDVMQLRICVLLGALESSKDCELYDVLTMYTALKIYKHSYSNSTLGIYMFSYI